MILVKIILIFFFKETLEMKDLLNYKLSIKFNVLTFNNPTLVALQHQRHYTLQCICVINIFVLWILILNLVMDFVLIF
jgi:hypothetical protein